jgi:hypothetical protein
MKEVAKLLHLALAGTRKREVVSRVRELRTGFQNVGYSFEESPAYFFR